MNHSPIRYVGATMGEDIYISRRTVLTAAAAGAGVAALAACSPSSNGSGGGVASSASQKTGVNLTKLADVPVGSAVSVQLPDGTPGIVARPTATTAAAFSAICTHMSCTVVPQGQDLICPCHGSVYNALTGAVLQGPAPSALSKLNVSVVNGEVQTTA